MLPKFTPGNMANGHTALKIHLTVDYESFPQTAGQLIIDLGASVVNKIDSADVLLWEIKIQGQAIDLVFDEMSGDFTLESDNKQSDQILQNLLNIDHKQNDQASQEPTLNKNSRRDDIKKYLNEKVLPFLNMKLVLFTLARASVLIGILLLAIKSFWVNFIPGIQYGILSLVISAPASWLIFHYLLKPIVTPFSGLFPKFSFTWKELNDTSNKGGLLFSGLRYKVVRVFVYLVRFKGFYIGFAYLVSYLAITFSVPALLNDNIGESFNSTSRLSAKSTSRSPYCRYHLKISDYGNIFSTGICVRRSTYLYIEPGNSVNVSGIQSWAGTYIKDIFRSGTSGY